jgi:hypothetical protein
VFPGRPQPQPRRSWLQTRSLSTHPTSWCFPPPDVAGIAAKVADAAMNLLDIDLGRALVDGWRTYSKILSVAQATATSPGTPAFRTASSM